MKNNSFNLIICSGLLLGPLGCSTDYRPKSVINTTHPYAVAWQRTGLNPREWSGRTLASPTEKYTYINPYTYNPSAVKNWDNRMINNPSESFYSKAISNANVASMSSEKLGKYYRNEMQNAILRTIKETTDQHMSGLKAAENQSNLLLGAATIGLAGGAAVVGGTAARALAAAATGTAGARSLVNEQVYRNTFVESLIALIQDDQEKFLAKIRLEQIKPIEDYTVEAAIMDAKEYERRGSFYHGLSLLQVAVQSKVNTGANPLVPSNQYGMLPPVLGSTNIVEIRMPLATDSLTPTTIEQLWAGERFSQIISDPTVTPAALANAVKVTINRNDTTDHSLKLKFATTNKTALTVTDGKLVFDYSYQATSGKLSIPITLIIGSK